VSNLSAAGTAVGLSFGVAVSPIVAAFVARPPLAPTADPPAHRPTGEVRLRAGLVTIGVCGVTGLRVGWRWPLAAFLVFSAGLAALGLCDRYWRVLPKRVVYPTWVAGLAGLTLAAGLDHRWSSLADAALGGAVLFAIFAVLHLVAPAAIAFGDARIAGPVGTALGWWGGTTVIIGLTAGFVAAAIVSLILIAAGRLERQGSVPLGTYLGAGAAIVVWVWH
jgi:leader peptidase (prepilin peptidase)/N-methyltransferase